MATRPPKPASPTKPPDVHRDPHDLWSGGDDIKSNAAKSAVLKELQKSSFQDDRVLSSKIELLKKALQATDLSATERKILLDNLKTNTEAAAAARKAADEEVRFLKRANRYGGLASRHKASVSEAIGTLDPKVVKANKENLDKLTGILETLRKQDIGTEFGRKALQKGYERVSELLEQLPDNITEAFNEAQEVSDHLFEEQRALWQKNKREDERQREEYEREQKKALQELEEAAADARKTRAEFRESQMREGFEAHQRRTEARQARNRKIGHKVLGGLDHIGIGSLNYGNLARGVIGAHHLYKNWKGGHTGIQQWAQDRATAHLRDPSKLRFGLGNGLNDRKKTKKSHAQDAYEAYKAKFSHSASITGAGHAAAAGTAAKIAQYAGSGSFAPAAGQSDQEANDLDNIAKTLQDFAGENQRFNSRVLTALRVQHPAAANDARGTGIGSGIGQAVENAGVSTLMDLIKAGGKGLITTLGSVLAEAAPFLFPAVIAGLALKSLHDQKQEIDAHPRSEQNKNIPEASVARGDSKTVGEAAAKNRRRAIRTLPPGTAKQYLDMGPDKDGKYLDGYTKDQLERMAKGQSIDPTEDLAGQKATMSPDPATVKPVPDVQAHPQEVNKTADGSAKPVDEAAKKAGVVVGTGAAAVKPPTAGPSSAASAAGPGPGSGPGSASTTATGGNAATAVSVPQSAESASASASPSSGGAAPPTSGGGAGPGAAASAVKGGMIKDGLGKIFTKSGGVDTDGVKPQMQSALVSMGQEYFEKTGKKINFNSAYRSIEDQAKLYKTMKPGMAAKPGSSLHNFGLAVDIPSTTANELSQLGLLNKYGFERPIPGEKWHIQPKGMSVAAAKSGIFSADAPSDQGDKSAQSAKATSQAPTVADASTYDAPAVAAASSPSGTSGAAPSKSGNTRAVSVASLPTFDGSDGLFLTLNMGVIS